MSMEQTRIKHGGIELLDSIAQLWEKLNHLHADQSAHFSNFYRGFTFADRKRDLIQKAETADLQVALCLDTASDPIGYCVTTAQGREGEIESIYVEDAYRNLGIGTTLMLDALAWLNAQGINRIKVSVAAGNEAVFSFYQKFGLYPRITILVNKNWHSTDPSRPID